MCKNQSEKGENTEVPKITREEIEKQIWKLKKKTHGKDGIQSEVWIIPLGWREGIICPIHRKGTKRNKLIQQTGSLI